MSVWHLQSKKKRTSDCTTLRKYNYKSCVAGQDRLSVHHTAREPGRIPIKLIQCPNHIWEGTNTLAKLISSFLSFLNSPVISRTFIPVLKRHCTIKLPVPTSMKRWKKSVLCWKCYSHRGDVFPRFPVTTRLALSLAVALLKHNWSQIIFFFWKADTWGMLGKLHFSQFRADHTACEYSDIWIWDRVSG